MIATSTQQDIEEHLRSVGLEAGMDVVVHSSLMAFGKIDDAAQTVWNALIAVLGDQATIAAPTYTFGTNDSDNPYNRAQSESTNVGVMGEFIRKLPNAVRSKSPIHSHVALGPKASLLDTTPETSSMGPGTDFEVMKDNGFLVLLLGCGLQHGCTYLHHMEAMAEVPYRKWIDLSISIQADEQQHTTTCRYFARDDDGYKADFAKVQPALGDAGLLKMAKAPYGKSFLINLKDLDQKMTALLAQDPYCLVSPI